MELKLSKILLEFQDHFPSSTLSDEMTLEWIIKNWEWLVQIEKLNKSGREILSLINLSLLSQKNISKNHKRIILVGKGASGKDHFKKLLESKGFKSSVCYTTRPPRNGEINEKDYFFITEDEFKGKIEKNEFYEYASFNKWYYGTTKKDFFDSDIFIMTPSGISKINSEDRKNSLIIYLDINEYIRRERLSKRIDADSVQRRIDADEKDFQNYIDFDLRILNHNF